MDNPTLILSTVDSRLDHEVRLVLYGRSAVCLGFNDPPPEAAKTQDVDAIVSSAQSKELEQDSSFWSAVEGTNLELASIGLYITHLFPEEEIFLRTGWRNFIVPVARPRLRWLRLSRPATVDLILTKMMRGDDPQDMTDASFMIRHDRVSESQLLEAFAEMKPIKLVELRDAFERAKPIVLKFTRDSLA